MGKLTTHVLDTTSGTPAEGVKWILRYVTDEPLEIARGQTNADGRSDTPLLSGPTLITGTYELEFQVASYFRDQGITLPEPAFLDDVVLRFGVADVGDNYHVPLLVSPYGYSTYRGS